MSLTGHPMIASIFMLVVTTALFALWFRYTCGLILNAKPAKDYARQVATANELRFLQIHQRLAGVEGRTDLDAMQKHLDRDYRLLTYILRHGAQFQIGGDPLERRILMLDFEMLRMWYAVCRWLSVTNGRNALEEMISIITHLANFLGERALCRAE